MDTKTPHFAPETFIAATPDNRVVPQADVLRLALGTDQSRQLLDARSTRRFQHRNRPVYVGSHVCQRALDRRNDVADATEVEHEARLLKELRQRLHVQYV